jgi:glyceraldehyde-3-phosphate dehydrogenase (NAD(P))
MEEAGLTVAGTLDDLVRQSDVVVDCTPKGVAAQNRILYERAGVKAIFQGGEKHGLARYSFVAGLCRVLKAFHQRGSVKRARGVLLRRGTPGRATRPA